MTGDDTPRGAVPAGWWVTALCFATAMVEGFDIQAMGVAAPTMIPALHLTAGQAGWAFSASLFGLMLGAGIGGVCADRIGRRPVLIASTLLFGVMTLTTILGRDYPVLLAVRLAAGLGLGGAMPMVIAISAERAGEAARVGRVATASAGMPLGAVVAGLLARTFDGPDSWRIIFAAGGAAALALALMQLLVLPETGGLPEAGEPRAAAPRRADTAAPGRVRLLVIACIGIALVSLMLHLMLNWLPTLLVGAGAPHAAGLDALILFNLGGMAGAVLLGRWVDRAGLWPAIPGACVALAIFLAALSQAHAVAAMSALGLAVGFCVVGSQFTLYGAASTFFPTATRGRGVGTAVAAGRLGSALGPLAAGQLLQLGVAPADVFRLLALTALLAAAMTTLLARHARALPETGEVPALS